jgi:hypothetical protein
MKPIVQFLLILVALLLLYFIGITVFLIYSTKHLISGTIEKYWHNIAVSLDQTGASLFGWDNDVTISERVGLEIMHGRANWFIKLLCRFLSLFDYNHCEKQAVKYYKEREEDTNEPFKTI